MFRHEWEDLPSDQMNDPSSTSLLRERAPKFQTSELLHNLALLKLAMKFLNFEGKFIFNVLSDPLKIQGGAPLQLFLTRIYYCV
jgi:hypothetical protein